MQTREKNLAFILGGVLAVMAVWTILKPWYFDPIDQVETQLASVQQNLDKAEQDQLALLSATRKMAQWKAHSLPPDPKPPGRQRPDALNGQRLYQEWLTDLANHCGFRKIEVRPNGTRAIQDVYVTAQVKIEAEATYPQLCQFLSLFEQTELMHRVETCQLESPTFRGDPLLDVMIIAEGMVLQKAPERDFLFPKTELVSPIDATTKNLTVKTAKGFPESGSFQFQIGEEFLTATKAKGDTWQILRGQDKSKPQAHAAGAVVDLGLFDALDADKPAKAPHPRLAMIAEINPFTIPVPPQTFKPYLNAPREQTVYLGNELVFDVRVDGMNPTFTPPKWELDGEVPKGLTLEPMRDNPKRATIIWNPADDTPLDRYRVSVKATHESFAKPLSGSVSISVRQQNVPPRLESIDSQVVYSGQSLQFQAKASDEDRGQRLTYSLNVDAPLDANIDPNTGKFTFTPPGVVTEQSLEIEVIVTDDGRPSQKDSLKVPIEIKPDVASFTFFVGYLDDSRVREAWLNDKWNNRPLVVQEGKLFEQANITAKLIKVEPSLLLFERNGETWELELGKSLREMKLIESSKTARKE